ncbi:MAG: hypothetical protein H0W12_09575 [Chitinophagaceae bacterium]|nr:hypothetical protein [Chitinophagaceae bacterium]
MKMRIPIIIISLLACVNIANAQLFNNGATITIQSGAYLMSTGDIRNVSGTITNDGKIEVQGNFINSGTYTSTLNEDSLIMTGTGPDTLTSGGATLHYLTINKTNPTDIVRLGGTLLLTTKLDYLSGSFTTDPINNPLFSVTSPLTAVYNFAPLTEISGSVKRTGTFVSGTPYVFNQPNMLVTLNGGSLPTDFTVTMIPQSAGGDPTQNEREVKRKFLFASTGGSAFTTDIRYPYVLGELNTNVEANIVPWQLLSGEWNGRLTPVTRDQVNHYVGLTGLTTTDLTVEWKLADPKYTFNVTALLRGPWNGTTMNTTINGIIPTAQPYNTTPFNYAGPENTAVPNANVVDWVLIEHRKPSTGLPADATSATITGRKAGFLLNDGTVVDLDGVTPIAFNITKQGPAFIVVRHRNHLGVLSNVIPSNALGTFANDYSVLSNSYKATGASSDPVVLLQGGVKYGLWAGDANKNGAVNAADINSIKVSIAGSASGYLFTDINLSNSINVTDVNLTKVTISSSGTGSAPNRLNSASVVTNIPDPIVK